MLLRDEHMPQAAVNLERMGLEKLEGTTLKHCSNPRCKKSFVFAGDGTKTTARVHCPLSRVDTCVRCNKAWHNGPCERNPEEEALLKDENTLPITICVRLF